MIVSQNPNCWSWKTNAAASSWKPSFLFRSRSAAARKSTLVRDDESHVHDFVSPNRVLTPEIEPQRTSCETLNTISPISNHSLKIKPDAPTRRPHVNFRRLLQGR